MPSLHNQLSTPVKETRIKCSVLSTTGKPLTISALRVIFFKNSVLAFSRLRFKRAVSSLGHCRWERYVANVVRPVFWQIRMDMHPQCPKMLFLSKISAKKDCSARTRALFIAGGGLGNQQYSMFSIDRRPSTLTNPC